MVGFSVHTYTNIRTHTRTICVCVPLGVVFDHKSTSPHWNAVKSACGSGNNHLVIIKSAHAIFDCMYMCALGWREIQCMWCDMLRLHTSYQQAELPLRLQLCPLSGLQYGATRAFDLQAFSASFLHRSRDHHLPIRNHSRPMRLANDTRTLCAWFHGPRSLFLCACMGPKGNGLHLIG